MNFDKKQLRNTLLLLLGALIWGTAFVAQSVGSGYVGPYTFLAARSWLACAFLIVLVLLRRGKARKADPGVPFWINGRMLLRGGVFCGSLFCCLNYDTQAVELYNGSTLLGSYSQEIARTSSADLRGNPSMYTVEMRVRGNQVRVYSGSSYTLRFTAAASGFSGGYAGYRSDNTTVCELLRLGDAWTYEPYERFDVEMPDGSFKSYGRISRSNCTWDEEFQVFTLTSDVEESSTRSEDISLDYDFFHSDLLEISCGGNYTARIIPKDINIWISRLFLGDADGFSILYYQDVDSLVYWANQAAYRWKLRGMCMWSLGQEDMRLWEWLPKQI